MNAALPRADEVFAAALALTDANERSAYLAGASGGNEALRREVESLLAAHAQAGAFLELPARARDAGRPEGDGVGGAASAPLDEEPGDRIGHYRLLERIGEGGFGVVWLAEQEAPVQRRVALKIIKLGMDTRQVVARFEAERQALAMMDHPSIARIFDGGATALGRPYFVMELVRGLPITEFCDQRRLPTSQRLELFVTVCQAIQHAHQKGVIHRDLKPSNILVTGQDDRLVAKVIDFGVAKATEAPLTDKALATRAGQWVGTPAYMSPEQAGRAGMDVDTRADIYSLGVILYALLTGRPPLESATQSGVGLEAMMRRTRETDPPKPSTRLSTLTAAELSTVASCRQTEPVKLRRRLRGDLDWIVMKCLEKERDRRYETANGLARDLLRSINHEAVFARPPTAGYRLRRTLRRHRASMTALSAIFLLLLAGLVVTTRLLHLKTIERARALAAEQRAEANLYAADINLAFHAFDDDNLGTALDLLEHHRPKAGSPDRRGWEWHYLQQRCQSDELFQLSAHSNGVTSLCFTPSGQLLASGSQDRTVKIWDLTSRRLVATLPHPAPLNGVAFSGDGQWLATAVLARGEPVRLWDWRAGRVVRALPEFAFVRSLAFSPDDKTLAGASEEGTALWAPGAGRLLARLPLRCSSYYGQGLGFSPDGRLLAAAEGRGVRLWDLTAGAELGVLTGHDRTLNGIAFSRDGKLLASASWDRTVRVWDVATRREVRVLTNHVAWVSSAVFLPEGSTLATAGADQRIRFWRPLTDGQEIASLKGYRQEVWALACSPDGQRLASGDKAGTLRVWSARPPPAEGVAVRLPAGRLLWEPGGRADDSGFGILCADGGLLLGSVSTLAVHPRAAARFALSNTLAGAVSGRGRVIAQALTDDTIHIWDWESKQEQTRLGPLDERILALEFSPDGERLAAAGRSRFYVWQTRGARQVACWTNDLGTISGAYAFGFSPDGRQLYTGHASGAAWLWPADGGAGRVHLNGHREEILSMAVSPARELVATTSDDGTLKLWDRPTGKELATLRGQLLSLHSVAFYPDGSRVAAGSGDGLVKLWDTTSFRELATLRGGAAAFVSRLAFLPDGRTLVAATSLNGEWELHCWRAVPRRATGPPRRPAD